MDTSAVRDVAGEFEAASALLDATIRTYLWNLRFDGATAGRAHTARGDSLRTALGSIADGVAQWSRASEEIGATLRGGASRYQDADHRSAMRLG